MSRLRRISAVVLVLATSTACDDDRATVSTSPPFGARPELTTASSPVADRATTATVTERDAVARNVVVSALGDAATAPGSVPATAAPTGTVASTPFDAPAVASAAAVADATGAAPSSTAPPVALDQLALLDQALDDDGTISLPTALTFVAAGYRPIPGITPATQPLHDGDIALRTVVAHLDELSGDQRQAVLTIVDVPGQSPEQAAASGGVIADAAGLVTLGAARFSDLLRTTLPDGVDITLVELPYENADGSHNFSSAEEIATALAWSSSDTGRYDECRIRVNRDAAAADAITPEFVSAVAEETFHCFQFAQRPNGLGVPLWAFEGAAAFAGEEFNGSDGGSRRSTPWWTRWISEPQRPLKRRTSDALGFFALVDRSGADAYALATALLSDASADSVRRRLEGSGLFDRWGSQYAVEPSWNPPEGPAVYTIAGLDRPGLDPSLLELRPPQQTLALTVDGPRVHAGGLSAEGAMSATPYRFAVPAGVLVVTIGAGDHGRLRWTDGTELAFAEGTRAYCVLPTGCACPNLPAEQAAAETVATAEVFIGVGPFSGDGPALAATSLDAWCRDTLLAPPALGTIDPCLVRDWSSTGYQTSPTAGVETQTSGGEGASLRFDDDGTVVIDMSASEPVVLTARDAAGVVTTTTLTYRGQGTGRWGAADGVVAIAEVPTDSFSLRVTIDRTGSGRLADTTIPSGDPRRAAYASVLGTARYQCTDVALTLTSVTPSVGGTAAFTFA